MPRSKRRRRIRVIGVLPRLGRGLWAVCRWSLHHPHTFMIAGAACLAIWLLWGYVSRSEAFRIASVSMPAHSSLRLPQPLIGENLLTLDLRALSEQLKRQDASLKEVRVVRHLPNAVSIEPIPRDPVAQVRLDRWYPVDSDGFILPEGRREPMDELTRLVGFQRLRQPLKPGANHTNDRLRLALRVLARLQAAPSLVSRELTEVNVLNPQQIRFRLDGATEVRCGSEAELTAHLKRLRMALRVVARQQATVGYIDVRFQEPVLGPQT